MKILATIIATTTAMALAASSFAGHMKGHGGGKHCMCKGGGTPFIVKFVNVKGMGTLGNKHQVTHFFVKEGKKKWSGTYGGGGHLWKGVICPVNGKASGTFYINQFCTVGFKKYGGMRPKASYSNKRECRKFIGNAMVSKGYNRVTFYGK